MLNLLPSVNGGELYGSTLVIIHRGHQNWSMNVWWHIINWFEFRWPITLTHTIKLLHYQICTFNQGCHLSLIGALCMIYWDVIPDGYHFWYISIQSLTCFICMVSMTVQSCCMYVCLNMCIPNCEWVMLLIPFILVWKIRPKLNMYIHDNILYDANTFMVEGIQGLSVKYKYISLGIF